MASTRPSPTGPEAVGPRPARWAVGGFLATAVLASWACLLYLSWAMAHMDAVAMAMPAAGPWGASDLALEFVMWAVMMVGMMAPSAGPVVMLYTRVAQELGPRRRNAVRGGLFLMGYLLVWIGFGALATGLQWALHEAALLTPMMDRTLPLAGGAILLLAGLYQWTPLKNACLARCRSPLAFILGEWRPGPRGALVMGLRHGATCTACCWALMLVLFAVGVMNLWWVAAIMVFVLMEKALPGGARLARAAGLGLLAWGAWVIAGALGFAILPATG